MAVVVESPRDERVLRWLIDQAGVAAVEDACMRLAGSRRAYVSNIAKILGLQPPKDLELASRENAERHLAAINRILGRKQGCI
ncbi:MAG: cryptic plasmid protein A [Rhodocyclaceae bacterium]|nr:MAG: cryptic plasmid protein A [Rhodocyclaceae bacterium]